MNHLLFQSQPKEGNVSIVKWLMKEMHTAESELKSPPRRR